MTEVRYMFHNKRVEIVLFLMVIIHDLPYHFQLAKEKKKFDELFKLYVHLQVLFGYSPFF